MTQNIILVPASRLTKSPTNVRKRTDPEADCRLEANIAERGILQNLIGVPVARKKGHFRVTAGGRRIDAVHRLIEKGQFDKDYMVPVLPLADAKDAIEISLAENFFKLAMNPADACRAFQDIIETEGKTPADVAKRFGVTETFVHGRLRLAGLAEPIFAALAANEITLDVAMAYGSTSDVVRQQAIYEQLSGGYSGDNPNEIRRQIASYSYRAADPKALLVGRDAYCQAGGRIDNDFFTDPDSERWIDTQIVDALAAEKLAAAAEEIQAREGYREIRTVPSTHIRYDEAYRLAPLRGEQPELTAEQQARQSELEEQLGEMRGYYEDEDFEPDPDFETRENALEAELSAIVERTPILTDEQRQNALAYVVIGADGTPRVHEQLFVAPDPELEPGEDGEDETGTEAEVDGTAPKAGISQRLADELAMMKTELLAVHVANDPGFALDLGAFIMVDCATRRFGCSDMPSELRASAPSPRIHGFESGSAAATQWAEFEAGLDRSWREADSIAERYDAFCALEDGVRASWFAWAIARTLHAVPAGRPGSDFLDHLGAKLEIDVAAWWRPTARTYFDRINKGALLDLFEEMGGMELRSRYGASKKHDLAASAERLFAGDLITSAEVKAKAKAWLPPEMRFVPSVEDETESDADAGVEAQSGDTETVAKEVPQPGDEPDLREAA